MANDGKEDQFPGQGGDFHFMISYDCLQFCLNAAVSVPHYGGMQYASTYNTSGYTMEVMIPWSLLMAWKLPDVTPPLIGDTYHFDMQVDFNDGTSTRVGQLVWSSLRRVSRAASNCFS